MKTELCALDGHLVELVLRVLGKAGIGRIVGVGGVEGSGAGAERSVHEAFEEAGVEHGVIRVMMVPHADEVGQGGFEREPLGNAQIKIALLFHLLIDEKIVPVAEVLDTGDAVG